MDKLKRLTDHVWLLPFDENTDRPNIGYIKSGNEAVIFDAGCGPKTAKLLKSELAENGLPVPQKIILSHYHWDHSFGAGYTDGEMISSQYTYDKMAQMKAMKITSTDDFIRDDILPEFCREHMHMEYASADEVKLRLPDKIMHDRMTLDVGDVTIDIKEVVSPHCDGQIVRFVRGDGVLFLGDSFSAEIIGFDFIDNAEKRKIYYEQLKEFRFRYIVLGHFDIMEYDDFWKLARERLALREE